MRAQGETEFVQVLLLIRGKDEHSYDAGHEEQIDVLVRHALLGFRRDCASRIGIFQGAIRCALKIPMRTLKLLI
jgi:hypothetical protein